MTLSSPQDFPALEQTISFRDATGGRIHQVPFTHTQHWANEYIFDFLPMFD
jgi:hypothetical protein